MLRSLYSGVAGMRGFQTKLDVIGNNIANVNTVGYKESRVMFKDMLSQTVSGVTAPSAASGGVNAKQIGLGSTVASIDTVHTQGSAMTTNVVTDLRIDGDGFFAVSPDGTTARALLTRAGNFTVDANKDIVNADGMYLLDNAGAKINLGTATAFSISKNGEIVTVDSTGAATPSTNKIAVVKVANPSGLEKVGGNLYRVSPNAVSGGTPDWTTVPNDPAAGTGAIISGELEMSNVELTAEFTEMIVAQRGFQANSKIITTSDQILQEVVNLKQ